MTLKEKTDIRNQIIGLNHVGMNVKTIAYKFNYSVRSVQRILAQHAKGKPS